MSMATPLADSADRIIIKGESRYYFENFIEDATEMYPGRFVQPGSRPNAIVVSDGLHELSGFLGFERTAGTWRPALLTDAYVTGDVGAVHVGGLYCGKPTLLKGCTVVRDEFVATWTNGKVVGPVKVQAGKTFIGIPFEKSTTEKATAIVLPAGMQVSAGGYVEVKTAVAGATLDFGVVGNTDGFGKGVSLATAGMVQIATSGAGANLGDLLVETTVGETTATIQVPKALGYVAPSEVAIAYLTTDANVAGTIWVPVYGRGVKVVGQVAVPAQAILADTFVQTFINYP